MNNICTVAQLAQYFSVGKSAMAKTISGHNVPKSVIKRTRGIPPLLAMHACLSVENREVFMLHLCIKSILLHAIVESTGTNLLNRSD